MEARIEEIFALVNKDITTQGIKTKINNIVITGQGVASINKSDVVGKVTLNISNKLEKNVELTKPDVTNSVDYNNMTQEVASEMLQNITKLPSYNLVRILLSNYLF